jgi:hypothetical protein
MSAKEAIAFLNEEKLITLVWYGFGAPREAILTILTALRASQKREREVFKRLSMICCRYYSKVCGCCYDQWGDSCCMKKCPLLKQKKEIK